MNNLSPSLNRKETLTGISFFFAQLLLIPIIVDCACQFSPEKIPATIQSFLCFALNFLCVIVLFLRFWRDSFKEISGKVFKILLNAAIFLGCYYLSIILINLIIAKLDPNFSNINDSTISAMVNEYRGLMIVAVVILVPPVEEFLHRGLIFGKLYPQSPLLAYTISILAFASIHVIGYIDKATPRQLLLCTLQYLPAGFFLAKAYARSGSLFTPILIHSIINLIGILAI